MKPLRLFIPALLAMTLATGGCKKFYQPYVAPTTLPPATQEGKHTFGFDLNGTVWLPHFNNFLVNSLTLDPANQISAVRGNQIFTMYLGNIAFPGIYDLNVAGRGAQFYDGTTDYISTQGTCVITRHDPTKGIVSGTFSLKATSNAGTVVSIDNGRFDLTVGVN